VLILASRSPRRRFLLRRLAIDFRAVAPAEEELPLEGRGGSYSRLVRRAARRKARSVARRGPEVALGADTIVVCDGEVMGKPASATDARRMLRKLSGRRHQVYTGIALVSDGRNMDAYERTEVEFRSLSKAEVERYVATGEPMDKAGAYAIQGAGAALIRAVRGCYTNVIGLPLPKLVALLCEFERASGLRIRG